MSWGPAAGRALGIGHLGAAAVLAARPQVVLGRGGDLSAPTVARALVAVLAGRHLVQGAALVAGRPRLLVRWSARTDALHVVSMAVWRPDDPSLRRFATRSGLLSAGFLLLSW